MYEQLATREVDRELNLQIDRLPKLLEVGNNLLLLHELVGLFGTTPAAVDLLNRTGQLNKAFGLDLPTRMTMESDEVYQISTESILGTIWGWIKAIFKFIGDMIMKLFSAIGNFLGLGSSDSVGGSIPSGSTSAPNTLHVSNTTGRVVAVSPNTNNSGTSAPKPNSSRNNPSIPVVPLQNPPAGTTPISGQTTQDVYEEYLRIAYSASVDRLGLFPYDATMVLLNNNSKLLKHLISFIDNINVDDLGLYCVPNSDGTYQSSLPDDMLQVLQVLGTFEETLGSHIRYPEFDTVLSEIQWERKVYSTSLDIITDLDWSYNKVRDLWDKLAPAYAQMVDRKLHAKYKKVLETESNRFAKTLKHFQQDVVKKLKGNPDDLMIKNAVVGLSNLSKLITVSVVAIRDVNGIYFRTLNLLNDTAFGIETASLGIGVQL